MEQVLGLVRNVHIPRSSDWLVSCAIFLMGHAFFNFSGTSAAPDQVSPTHSTPTLVSIGPPVDVCQHDYWWRKWRGILLKVMN